MENIDKEDIEKIKNIYFDPEHGLGGAQNIYEKLNKQIKLKDIKLVLKNINVKQVKETVNKKKKLYIPIVQVPNSYQLDLTFYSQFEKNNNGFGILLTIINMNSKYLYVYPLKNKNTNSIITAMKKFINEENTIKIIETDAGSEFISSQFKNLLEENNIQLLLFNKAISPNAMAIIERMNGTLRNKIDNYMVAHDTHKYIDVLEKLVNNINNTKSYSTGYAPNKVDEYKEKEIYGDKSMKKIKIINEINNKFKIGDTVKILTQKKLFSKGQSETYSINTYEITGKEFNKFLLKDLENGDKKTALPYQMKKIDNKNVVENPFIKDKKEIIKKDKIIFDKNTIETKQNKKLKRDGILDTINELKNTKKVNKKLKRNGIDKNNIIN